MKNKNKKKKSGEGANKAHYGKFQYIPSAVSFPDTTFQISDTTGNVRLRVVPIFSQG